MKLNQIAVFLLAAFAATRCAASGDVDSSGTRPSPALMESVRSPRVDKLFRSMRSGAYQEVNFPALTWADVPALLDMARSPTVLKAFPREVASSQYEATCSEGMVALWLIEGIRAGGKFPSLNALCFHVGENSTDWTKASAMTRRRLLVIYRIWCGKA